MSAARWRTLAIAAAAAGGLALIVALWPVRAERPDTQSGLQLSIDRTHWSTSLTDPLFDPDRRLTPGDTATRFLYIRNDGAGDSRVQVTIGTRDDRAADGDRWAVVSARTDSGRWTYLRDPDSLLVLRDLRLAPGVVRRVEVQATVTALAADATMGRQLQMDVDLRPLGSATETGSTGATWWGPAGPLARLAPAALGGLAVLAALAVARGRRREVLP
ncbi:MAG TPA: hypothetical protein VFI19_04745 [Nocardioides sp.]|nr:hypothetical protein [Nocardioides sp.]